MTMGALTPATILGLLYAAAVGYCFLRLVSGSRVRRGWIQTLAFCVPLGIGLMSLEAFLVSAVGLKLTLLSVGAPWVFLFVGWMIAVYLHPKPPVERRAAAPLTGIQLLLLTLIAFALLIVYFESMGRSVFAMDAVAMWAFKGRMFAIDGKIYGDVLNDPAFSYFHPDYPQNFPLAQTWLHLCNKVGQPKGWTPDDWTIRVLCFVFYACLLGLFYSCLRSRVGRAQALLFTALLALTPELLTRTTRLMATTPLATYFLGCLVGLLAYLESGRKWSHLILAAVFAGMAAWTKTEGAVFAFIVLAAVALDALRMALRQSARHLLRPLAFAALTLAVILPWTLFKTANGLENDLTSGLAKKIETEGRETVASDAVQRAEAVVSFYLDKLIYGNWALFWPGLLLTAVLCTPAFVRNGNWPITFVVVGWLAFIPATYLVTPKNFAWHMNYSLERLLVQILPCAFLLLARTWPWETSDE